LSARPFVFTVSIRGVGYERRGSFANAFQARRQSTPLLEV
jgi:hypothetical protein